MTRLATFVRTPGVPLKERILLYERLSLYLRSGVPLSRALASVLDGAPAPSRAALAPAFASVLGGIPLSASLSGTFPPFETQVVRIGEESGRLPESLAYLAALLRRRHVLKSKVRSALLYPAFVAAGSVLLTGFLLLYVFPKIVPLFRGLRTPLPLSTKLLIGVSDLVERHWLLLLLGGASVFLLICFALRRKSVRRRLEVSALRTLGIGPFVRAYQLALLSRVLSSLLASGIALLPALGLARGALKHGGYRSALASIAERINAGSRLSESLDGQRLLFPASFTSLVATGESTGSLAETLALSAELYEAELDERTRTLTTLIEPALMVSMGLVVGFIAIAIISPIYGITQSLTPR